MNAATFAIQSGYIGSSPAMLDAFEAIRQAGIREARKAHFARKATIDKMKPTPSMFFNEIRPSLSTCEAIEDAKRVIFGFRRLETWQQAKESRQRDLARAKWTMLLGRYFRRYGLRLWAQRAA